MSANPHPLSWLDLDLDLDGVGWYEVTHPTAATTLLAYVHEDGSVYFPETNDGQVEFALAAARGHVHRLVRADDAEAKVERQRDRVRARERQVRRLRAEVTRLHALVADLRAARLAPAWDEEAVTDEALSRARAALAQASPLQTTPWIARLVDEVVDSTLAVVREHLPTLPDRETVARALAEHRLMGGRCRCGLDPRLDYYRYEQHVTDAVLDLRPGRTESEIKEEALREAKRAANHDWLAFQSVWGSSPSDLAVLAFANKALDWLHARADRLSAEGGADRG